MAVVCVKNGFLTTENEDEIALFAPCLQRAKTVDTCSRDKAAALLDDEEGMEEADQSGEHATVDRLCMVLASGALLLDSVNMPEFVYFKTAHGTFLTGCSSGMLYCDRAHCLEWEKFKIIDHTDGTVSLMNFHGKFLGADQEGFVMCERQVVGDNEKWAWEPLNNGKLTLQSFHKKYLSAKALGTVKADVHEAAGPKSPGNCWESFEIVPHTESIRACQEDKGFRLIASHHGWFTGEEKDYSFARLEGYPVPSNRKLSNMSSEKDVSHSHALKTRDHADSFSTTDGDLPTANRKLSDTSSETDMPNTRDYADSFSTSDDDLPTTNRKFSNMSSMSDVDDLPTTLMIRNIPNQYAQKEFSEEFDSLGFKGAYNFLYLPMDRKTQANVGYCFVNFVDHHWAAKCTEVFPNYLLKKQRKGKCKYARVSTAHLQGLEANVAHYRDKGVVGGSGRQCGPLIVGNL
jgi:hypothetical protein